jgi:uncharacterized Zn-finger protein
MHSSRRREFSYNLCGFKTFAMTNLTNHIARMHVNTEILQCKPCNYRSKMKCDLRIHIMQVYDKVKNQDHIKSVHLKRRDYLCTLCDKRFSTSSYLKQHIKALHDKVRDRKCPLSDFTTAHLVLLLDVPWFHQPITTKQYTKRSETRIVRTAALPRHLV